MPLVTAPKLHLEVARHAQEELLDLTVPMAASNRPRRHFGNGESAADVERDDREIERQEPSALVHVGFECDEPDIVAKRRPDSVRSCLGKQTEAIVPAAYPWPMAEPTQERTIEQRVGDAREGLTLLADYL